MVDRMVCSAVLGVSDLVSDLADVGVLDDAALLERSHLLEVARRRGEAAQVGVLGEIERRGLQAVDGLRGVDGWGRAVHRWSSREARARRALIRLGRAAPEVLERLADGRLGVAQAHLLATEFLHPRVGQLLLAELPGFLDDAANVSMATFEQQVTNWRLLADHDGHDPARAMRDRSATLSLGDVGFSLAANGPIIDAVQLQAILNMYVAAEYAADWAWTRAEYGDAACDAFMPRTTQQRRYDALVAIFDDAASTAPGSSPNAPLVNFMIDQFTYDETLDQMFGTAASATGEGPARRYSQTTDGRHVPPADIVIASIRGQIRRVVTDHRGVVLDMGRRQRLFTGANRQAVLLVATMCTHPGCLVAASLSQADHLTPFGHGGHTRTADASPGCGHHNRWRYTAGAVTTLDNRGRWTTRRADGTDIAPPDHPHHAA